MTSARHDDSATGAAAPDGPRSVVHVSVVHRANDVRVFDKECRTLAAAGYRVTLYARTEQGPYESDGVRVVPAVPPSDGSGRSPGRLHRMTVGVWGLLRPLLAERADIYHLHDPELMPLGLALRLCGKAVVYDAHEDLPAQVLGKQWIPGPLRRIVAGASWLAVRLLGSGFDAVIAATPTVAEAYGYPDSRRTDVVHNYPVLVDDGRFVPYDQRPLDLVYVGGVSELRGFSAMLDAMPLIRQRLPEARLHLVGPFLHQHTRSGEPMRDRLRAPELAGAVEYHGLLPPASARAVMGNSRVGLAVLHRTKAHEDSIPNKLFEYMAETLPVVASDFPLWAGILGSTDTGVVVDPDAPDLAQRLADAALDLLTEPAKAAAMAERGRNAVVGTYSWGSEAGTLLARYDTILARRSRRTPGTRPGSTA